MKRLLAWGSLAITAAGAVLGWGIARRLTAPAGQRKFDLVIRDVEQDGDRCLIVMDRTCATSAKGIYNLWFDGGGWAQLSAEVLDRGAGRIARVATNASSSFSPKAGDRASWSGIYFASPADAGLGAKDVTFETAAGPSRAWLFVGESDPATWAIHIHGLGSIRAGTLRGVLAATEQGYTSLVINYRNDGEGPGVDAGRSTLGIAEVEDAEAALEYALRHGARRIVLFGWSMGAAIALQLADRWHHRGVVAGLVLDSPVLDWVEAIKANCVRTGLPAVTGVLAVPWLTLRPLSRMLGLPRNIPLGSFDWVTRAGELRVPTLIVHGTRDDSAPIRVSVAVSALRPDLVQLEVFDAGHTLSWNSDPDRWNSTLGAWLSFRVPR